MFAIRPEKETDRELFEEYRREDVMYMFIYICIFTAVATVAFFLAWVSGPTTPKFIIFFAQFILTCMHGLTWKLGHTYRNWYVFMIAALYVFAHILMTVTIELVIETYKTEFVGWQSRIGGIFIYCLIIAPNLKYVAIYAIVFYVNILFCILRYVESDAQSAFAVMWFLLAVIIFTFWFIFQKRELKRFFQTEDAKTKERKAVMKQD